MKKYLSFFLCMWACSASAQFSVQGSGLRISAGTVMNINDLVLTPSSTLTLTNQTIAKSSTPVPGNPSGASISQVYKFTSPINFSGTAAIKYTSGNLNGNTESLLQIAYNPLVTSGTYVTTTGSTTGAAGSYYVSKAGLSGVNIGQITATNGANILPVRVSSFKASAAQNCTVVLNWTAESTPDQQSFEAEYSINGTDWHAAGEVRSSVSGSASYTTTDLHPAPGILYYRLKTTGINGTVNYSDIATVRSFCSPEVKVLISPNPTSGLLYVKLFNAQAEKGTVEITDAGGRSVKTVNFSGTSAMIDLSGFSKGIYGIICRYGTSVFKQQVILK